MAHLAFQDIDFIAKKVANSRMFPSWSGRESDAAVAILFGQSLGLNWGYSLTNIMVVNGRPTVWGDAMLALCRSSSILESCYEVFDKETMTASCTVKRKGEEPQIRTFSKEDAITAKLWGKNVWLTYPERMLQMRARAFALRDVFPDILQGLGCTEEVMDYPEQGETKNALLAIEQSQEKPINFERLRLNTFKGFEMVGISFQEICRHYEKQLIEDFTEQDVNDLIETGKAIRAGEIKASEAFPVVHREPVEPSVTPLNTAIRMGETLNDETPL